MPPPPTALLIHLLVPFQWKKYKCTQPNASFPQRRLKACDTHSFYSNRTSISWIQWLGKRQRSGDLRALVGLQCHNGKIGSLGKSAQLWKPHRLHGNHSVDTAITSSSQQIHHYRKAACCTVCRMDHKIIS